jgi:hypothetical protein
MMCAAVLVVAGAAVFSSMTRFQRNALANRAYTNAYHIIRNVMDQAMQRGWSDPNSPLGVLVPTVANAGTGPDGFDTDDDITSTNSNGRPKWRRWNVYTSEDDVNATVPIYQDQEDENNEISARLYRKVQRAAGGTNGLLWITLRIEYTAAGRTFAEQLSASRALD